MSDVEEWSKPLHHNKYTKRVGLAKQKHKSRMMESRILGDFCAEKLRDYHMWFHQPLGPFYEGQLTYGLTNNERDALSVWRYYCDAIGTNGKDLVLIEAAVKFDARHVGALEGYAVLLSMTPEVEPYIHLPFRAIAVAPIFDGLAQHLCRKHGIEMHWFCPLYVKSYLETLLKRKQRSSMTLLPSMCRHGDRYSKGYRI